MNSFDIIIVFFWSILTLGLGIWAGIKSNFLSFWLNSKSTNTSSLVFTIVATQVGGGTILGIASSTYSFGTGFAFVALFSTITGFLLLGFFAPRVKAFGEKSGAISLPEIFGVHYGKNTQRLSGLLIFFAYLSMLGGQLLATSAIISVSTGISLNISVALASGGVILYSAFAGLRGDIVTDKLHFFVMFFILILVLLPIVLFSDSVFDILSNLPARIISPITFGGYTYLIAGLFFGAIIPVVSMELWLRIFASSSEAVAKKSLLLSSLVIIPFYLIALFIGLIAFSTIPNIEHPDNIFVLFLYKYLPVGLLGLGIASLFAVVISTANTLIVVLGAVVYRDILGLSLENNPNNLKLSRIITLSIGILGTVLAYTINDIVQLVLNSFFIISILFPPLLAILINKPISGRLIFLSLLASSIIVITLIPYFPTQAFLPGLLLSFLLTAIGVKIKTKS